MPIRDMPPISTGLPGRKDHPFDLPINEKVAVIPHVPLLLMTTSCLRYLVQHCLIAHVASCEHFCINISPSQQMLPVLDDGISSKPCDCQKSSIITDSVVRKVSWSISVSSLA